VDTDLPEKLNLHLTKSNGGNVYFKILFNGCRHSQLLTKQGNWAQILKISQNSLLLRKFNLVPRQN